jgi:hypothetical protein
MIAARIIVRRAVLESAPGETALLCGPTAATAR